MKTYGEGGCPNSNAQIARLLLKLRRQEELIGLRRVDEHFQLEALGRAVRHYLTLAMVVHVEEA